MDSTNQQNKIQIYKKKLQKRILILIFEYEITLIPLYIYNCKY